MKKINLMKSMNQTTKTITTTEASPVVKMILFKRLKWLIRTVLHKINSDWLNDNKCRNSDEVKLLAFMKSNIRYFEFLFTNSRFKATTRRRYSPVASTVHGNWIRPTFSFWYFFFKAPHIVYCTSLCSIFFFLCR